MIASEYVWIYACACSMPKWWCTLCKRCTILFIWWAKNIKHSVWKDMRRGKSDSNTFRAPAFLSHFEKTWNDKFKLHSRAVTLFIWNSFIKIYFLCLFRFGNTVLLGKWTEKNGENVSILNTKYSRRLNKRDHLYEIPLWKIFISICKRHFHPSEMFAVIKERNLLSNKVFNSNWITSSADTRIRSLRAL